MVDDIDEDDVRFCSSVLGFHCSWKWKRRLLMFYLSQSVQRRCGIRQRKGNIFRGRSNAIEQVDLLDATLFKRMFRVDHGTFGELMEAVAPFMVQRNVTKAVNSSGSPVPMKSMLTVMLRWLAGTSYLDHTWR
jgi:hypothetical protein